MLKAKNIKFIVSFIIIIVFVLGFGLRAQVDLDKKLDNITTKILVWELAQKVYNLTGDAYTFNKAKKLLNQKKYYAAMKVLGEMMADSGISDVPAVDISEEKMVRIENIILDYFSDKLNKNLTKNSYEIFKTLDQDVQELIARSDPAGIESAPEIFSTGPACDLDETRKIDLAKILGKIYKVEQDTKAKVKVQAKQLRAIVQISLETEKKKEIEAKKEPVVTAPAPTPTASPQTTGPRNIYTYQVRADTLYVDIKNYKGYTLSSFSIANVKPGEYISHTGSIYSGFNTTFLVFARGKKLEYKVISHKGFMFEGVLDKKISSITKNKVVFTQAGKYGVHLQWVNNAGELWTAVIDQWKGVSRKKLIGKQIIVEIPKISFEDRKIKQATPQKITGIMKSELFASSPDYLKKRLTKIHSFNFEEKWVDLSQVASDKSKIAIITDNKSAGVALVYIWLTFNKKPRFSISKFDYPAKEPNYGDLAELRYVLINKDRLKAQADKLKVEPFLSALLPAPYVYLIEIKAPDKGCHSAYTINFKTPCLNAVGMVKLDAADSPSRALIGSF